MNNLMQLIWRDLIALQNEFEQTLVLPTPDSFGQLDKDDEKVNLEHILYQMFDFIEIASTRKEYRHMFESLMILILDDKGPTNFLQELMNVMMTYFQLTTATVQRPLT